ncbi:MAG: hypothetical protein GY696_13790 [Gammaproteobacteria bacterium]|nr:hypothetical protein [Gammaproteobacteria bacterium]
MSPPAPALSPAIPQWIAPANTSLQYPDIPQGSCGNPLILSANVNSLPSKLDEMLPIFHSIEPAVFCIQETKLDAKISSTEVAVPNYQLFRKDRNRNGGGVGIYARDSLNPSRVRLNCPPGLEVIAVKIKLKRQTCIVISFYCPQKNMAPDFVSDLCETVAPLSDGGLLYLCGDSNIDFLSEEARTYDPLCNGLDFIQLIDSATHGGHCLDNIFTNDRESYQSVGISAPIESLHCVTWVTVMPGV